MGINVREAQPEDAKQIAEAKIASWRAAYQHIVPDVHLKELSVKAETNKLKFYITASQTSKAGAHFFVAEDAGKVIGFVAVGPMRDDLAYDAEIYAIYVHPDHDRKGAGRALFKQAKAYMMAQNWQNFALWVLKDNQIGIQFYKKMQMAYQSDADAETVIGCANLIKCLYVGNVSD